MPRFCHQTYGFGGHARRSLSTARGTEGKLCRHYSLLWSGLTGTYTFSPISAQQFPALLKVFCCARSKAPSFGRLASNDTVASRFGRSDEAPSSALSYQRTVVSRAVGRNETSVDQTEVSSLAYQGTKRGHDDTTRCPGPRRCLHG